MEIGTLKELNVKPGDVVEWLGTFGRKKDFVAYKIGYAEGGVFRDSEDGEKLIEFDPWRIISRAPQSPVRTVTRTEIVPGVYGTVVVDGEFVRMDDTILGRANIGVLNDAIETLTRIRDALENNA